MLYLKYLGLGDLAVAYQGIYLITITFFNIINCNICLSRSWLSIFILANLRDILLFFKCRFNLDSLGTIYIENKINVI